MVNDDSEMLNKTQVEKNFIDVESTVETRTGDWMKWGMKVMLKGTR